jgi:hypothetical protein
MRSDDDEIGFDFLGDPQNFGIDADAVRDEGVGIKIGGVDPADQGTELVFKIRSDQLVGKRCALGLQDCLDLAHDREDVKPGAEGAGELDRRDQRLAAGGFIIQVKGNQDIFVDDVNLAQSVVKPVSNISLNRCGAVSVIDSCL